MARTLEYILNLRDGMTDRLNRIGVATDQTTNKFSRLRNQISNIPGLDFITNPIVVASGAMLTAGRSALKWDEGMAQVNTTAQLTNDQLDTLDDKLMKIGLDGSANLSLIPEAYEKILSQTGDVTQSTEILEAALKGSKAGFTETSVVAGALAQSLSLIGKENANAQDVLDTFFAAKRVGAGEFKDFANYMPSLIASGKALGLTYKTTAGLFAYMTGKGFAAEKSATLLENAYTALGKSDIQKGLGKAGIKLFDKDGMMRDVGLIFPELQKKMASMSDNKKSNFLESIGLRDAQAKSAIMALTSDAEKLKEALHDTSNSAGETEKAFEAAQNPIIKIQALWTKMQYVGLKTGKMIMYVFNPALDGMNWLFDKSFKLASWWIEKLQQGQPVILLITGVIGSLAVGYAALAVWQGIVAASTAIWTGVQWALNIALTANPVGLIIAAIVALIAVIGYVIYKTDGWGKMWEAVVNRSKLIWNQFTAQVTYLWEGTVNGFMLGINKIKAGWYDFKNAVGLGDASQNDSALAQISADTEARKQAITGAKTQLDLANKAVGADRSNVFANLSWNKKGVKEVTADIKGALGIGGIAPIKLPGGLDNSAISGADGKGKGKAKGLGKTNEAIATGGNKSNYITINLKNLVENLNISAKDFKEGSNQMQEQVNDVLMRTLAMATTAAV